MEGIFAILRRYVATTILISTFLLILNFVLLGTLVFKEINQRQSPESVLKQVAGGFEKDGDDYALNGEAMKLLDDNEAWAMLLGEDGGVKWEHRLPEGLPRSYSLIEVAKFSRFYLMDYPVYIWEKEDGLFVMGYPQKSFQKYQVNFLYDWVRALPLRLLLLLLLNMAVALAISLFIGARLLKRIKPLVAGVHRLAREENVQLDAGGIFNDLAASINSASDTLQRKTDALRARDEARSNWIAGISHDIRTPLSMVLGYASQLEENNALPEEQRGQAAIIRRQGEQLRSLVNDLNLVSMLEYDMQPLRLKPVRLSVLARRTAADIMNGGLDESYSLELNLEDEATQILGDEKLLLRAIANLVHNSIRHNPKGCTITLAASLSADPSFYRLAVSDNGRGMTPEQLADATELPFSSRRKKPVRNGHGLGLPMVARIAAAQRGRLLLESGGETKGSAKGPTPNSTGGMTATLEFPVLQREAADKKT